MKLLQWTLFIDMLGYKNINGSIDNKEKALELINFMKENAEIFQAQDSSKRKILYSQEEFNLYEFYEPKYCFVSDSLIISFEPKEIKRKEKFKNEFVRHSANVAIIIMMRLVVFIFKCYQEKNIFLRGGISNKFSYIDGSIAVGEGVGAAYDGECAAINPKIILCEDVVSNKKLMKEIRFLSKAMYADDNLYTLDNGHYFLDYLKMTRVSTDVKSPSIKAFLVRNGMLKLPNLSIENAINIFKRHKEAILHNIEEVNIKSGKIQKEYSGEELDHKNKQIEKILDKYNWLKDYHNRECEKLSWVHEYKI